MANEKILIVDDDPDFTGATAVTLESAGYTVTTTNDGEAGLDLARKIRPDLIILDIMMSYVLEGLSVGAKLRADPNLAETPILMLSAIVRTEHVGDFPTDEPLPAQFYMTKPVPAAKLIETVRWMLDRSKTAPASV
jgi:DNA-binding response OmpR family regulator